MKISSILFLLLIGTASAFSQEHESESQSAEHGKKSSHSITFMFANTFLSNSVDENTSSILVVPVYGLNYDYQINHKWGLGLHTDVILQQYKIEKHGSEQEIIRDNPVSIVGILSYKPHHRWKIIGGYGVELEKNESFQIVRIGAEYGIELPKNWELSFALEYDFKLNGYNALVLGIGFTKTFGHHE